MRTLAVVPARGGSKGVVRKNLRKVGGKPMIAHTIEGGLGARRIDRLVVSTEDDEIARVSRSCGADVPFERPVALATDTASQVDVVIHALGVVEDVEAASYDCVVLLQPTAPLRTSEDIDHCIEKLECEKADCVISFSRVEHGHPYYMYTLEGGCPVPLIEGSVPARRQDFPAVYVRNGAIYAVRRDVLVNDRSFYGRNIKPYIMPYERSVNIDTELDLAVAELFFRERGTSDDPTSQRRA